MVLVGMLRSNVFHFLLITWRVVSLAWEYIALKIMSCLKSLCHISFRISYSLPLSTAHSNSFSLPSSSLFTLNSYIVGWLSYSRWVWSVYSGDRRTQV